MIKSHLNTMHSKMNIKSVRNRKIIIQQLIQNIKKKYAGLKLGKIDGDETLERLYTPITKQLKRIEDELGKKDSNHKTVDLKISEPQYSSTPDNRIFPRSQAISFQPYGRISTIRRPIHEPEKEEELQEEYTPFTPKMKFDKPPKPDLKRQSVTFLPTKDIVISKNNDDDDGDRGNDSVFIDGDNNESEQFTRELNDYHNAETYLQQYPEKVRDYVYSALTQRDNYDHAYGPKYDYKLSKWTLGKSDIDFHQKTGDLLIGNERFNGTDGLYNLLFKKEPQEYNKSDLENYRKILTMTNVHRRKFVSSNPVKSNKGFKYLNIIKPSTGHGLMTFNEKPIEYIYWNDVNEIVNRLRLLYASKAAGNTSVDNEIESIVEELREEKVIY